MKRFFLSLPVVLGLTIFAAGAHAQNADANAPEVVAAVAPLYPAAAISMNIEGAFQVDVKIDRKGKVVSSKAIDGTHRLVQKSIELAADQWKFAADENAPKRRHARLTFVFRRTPDTRSTESTPIFYPPYKIEVREDRVVIDTVDY